MDILPFVKPLNVVLTERFVLIEQNWNFKRKYDYKQFKYKTNFQFGLLFICGQILCRFFFIAYHLPVIVKRICLSDNFEKLSMLLGFSRDIMEGWVRGCCVHVFLVYIVETEYPTFRWNVLCECLLLRLFLFFPYFFIGVAAICLVRPLHPKKAANVTKNEWV